MPLDEETETTVASRTLPLIKVRGAPFERGFQHGRQCGDLIRRYPDVLLDTIAVEASWRALDRSCGIPTREVLFERALGFLPQMEAYAPDLVEEVRGIAAGARVPFAEALLVNVRAEVMGMTDGGCTAFAVDRAATADKAILAGQNLDQNRLNQGLLVVLQIEPDHGPSMLMCTFGGLVGYSGLNSAGVAAFQNALSTPAWRASGIPHYFMKRRLLEQTTLSGCLDAVARARTCSSGNYVLADRDAVVDVEVTPDGYAVVAPAESVVVHANHFVSPELVPQEALLPSLPDSACRAPRMADLIARRRGQHTVATLRAILRDHDGYPTSICRHQNGMISIAAMVADPDHGALHVAAGNPCENAFATYRL
jgi:isopenicillin-N N-acyltransferase-like protein